MEIRAYLGGPDVFRRDCAGVGAGLKAICARHGVVGVFPMDAEVTGATPQETAGAIKRANKGLIRTCHAMISNRTPFRGPGMDAGTSFEEGFAEGLGLPVFGYSLDARPYVERVRELYPTSADPDGTLRDPWDMAVEDFGLAENLMMAADDAAPGAAPLYASFEAAVAACARRFGRAAADPRP